MIVGLAGQISPQIDGRFTALSIKDTTYTKMLQLWAKLLLAAGLQHYTLVKRLSQEARGECGSAWVSACWRNSWAQDKKARNLNCLGCSYNLCTKENSLWLLKLWPHLKFWLATIMPCFRRECISWEECRREVNWLEIVRRWRNSRRKTWKVKKINIRGNVLWYYLFFTSFLTLCCSPCLWLLEIRGRNAGLWQH